MAGELAGAIRELRPARLVMTEPGDHRVRVDLEQAARVAADALAVAARIFERLAAREGEQALGEHRRALGALHRGIGGAGEAGFIGRQVALEDVEIAGDDLEQVVEIVRHASRHAADGIEAGDALAQPRAAAVP